MADKKVAPGSRNRSTAAFSDEERAAMKSIVQERKVVWGKNKADDERAVLAKIARMPEPDRSMGRRVHAVIMNSAPTLSPRLWYGMPAYTQDGNVVCFFQEASKFRARYATLGFSDKAKLDEGEMWPTYFAIKEWTPAVESRVAALIGRALR
jgi:uncharacterized protein YdhG (YjbR/CyaY superfamily)